MTQRRQRIAPGDIVRVHDGIPYLAQVREIERAQLIVLPMIDGRRRLAPRHVKRAWVDRHWRLVMDRVGDRPL